MNLIPRPRSLRTGTGEVPDTDPVVTRDASLPAQGYRLDVGESGIRIASADDAGAYYGRATLAQLRRLHGPRLPALEIADHPDLPVRGVMLDVSRDKVPTLDTLKALVARLASWKMNHLQLYTEHTFAYREHEQVWKDASPYTPDEIRELDAFCREHHVELAANQNCLGHMNRWLCHETYLPLALVPEGWTDPFGGKHPPMTMDPSKPEVLELVRGLLAELVPCFTSPRVHVGLDEPYGLSLERMGEYLDHLKALRAAPELRGREMLVWGDVLISQAGMLDDLPDGVTVCVWGYEGRHPFAEQVAKVRAAGRPFWVCPGTSTWLSLAGRFTNARYNLASAAEVGIAEGADGFLVCDWGDLGHLQYLPASEPPFAYAAAVSWGLEANRDLDVAAAVDVHGFDDPSGTLGAAILELADLYRATGARMGFISPLVLHLYYPRLPVGREFTEGLTVEDLEAVQARVDAVRRALPSARSRRPDASLVAEELDNTAALFALLCRDARARLAGDGTLRTVPEDERVSLAASLEPLIAAHERLWLARNRPGGLPDSRGRLERLAAAYREPPEASE